MGAGFFFARLARKAGFPMDGGNGGAQVRGQAQAGAQGAAEPEAAGAQVEADGGAGGAAGGSVAAGGGAAGGGAVSADAAGAAHAEYEAALAERDSRIAELEGQIAEVAKTVESAEKLRTEMDELRRQGEEQRVSFELTMAGARNVKAATVLLPDYDNDIEKLKAAEPWLFGAGVPAQPTGATGLPNAGAASDEGATLKRWRKIAGLDDEGKE